MNEREGLSLFKTQAWLPFAPDAVAINHVQSTLACASGYRVHQSRGYHPCSSSPPEDPSPVPLRATMATPWLTDAGAVGHMLIRWTVEAHVVDQEREIAIGFVNE